MHIERLDARVGGPAPVRAATADRADRGAAEDGVRRAYRAAGFAEPRVVWCESPLQIARAWKTRPASSGANLRRALVDEPCARALSAARRRGVTINGVQGRLWMRPSPSLGEAGVSTVVGREGERVRLGFLGRLHYAAATVRQVAKREGWPGFRASSVCSYDFAWLDQLDCDRPDDTDGQRLAAIRQTLRNTCWFVPHEATCWLSEPPARLSLDDRGRLHAPDGPAISFRDGWHYYAWKGMEVPGRYIEDPARINLHVIDIQTDIFVRRCLIEIVTPRKFVAMGGANLVTHDATGTLWRRTWPRGDAWAAVEVVNGTRGPDGKFEHYFLQVPPELESARAAVAWTYGMTEAQYLHLTTRT